MCRTRYVYGGGNGRAGRATGQSAVYRPGALAGIYRHGGTQDSAAEGAGGDDLTTNKNIISIRQDPRSIRRSGNPLFKLCAAMINSMINDLLGGHSRTGGNQHTRTKKASELMVKKAIIDLRSFKTWPLFIRAIDLGFKAPNDEQIERVIAMPKDVLRQYFRQGIGSNKK